MKKQIDFFMLVLEADIRRKLLETCKKKYELPEGWQIPLTTQTYDFRCPSLLSENAFAKTAPIILPNNLGQNGKYWINLSNFFIVTSLKVLRGGILITLEIV